MRGRGGLAQGEEDHTWWRHASGEWWSTRSANSSQEKPKRQEQVTEVDLTEVDLMEVRRSNKHRTQETAVCHWLTGIRSLDGLSSDWWPFQGVEGLGRPVKVSSVSLEEMK
ncbi:hypothetical protein NQZ68_008628 [Dissostichus eleginoides]|nr:hypothetical protein NQZ68_008628 [Dissostichus eleginoides]